LSSRSGWVWLGKIVVLRISLRWWLRLPQVPHNFRHTGRKDVRQGESRRLWTRRWSCLLRDEAEVPIRRVWVLLLETWARHWFCRMVSWMASDAGRGDSSWFEDAFSAVPARSRKVPTQYYRHSLVVGMSMASGTGGLMCTAMECGCCGQETALDLDAKFLTIVSCARQVYVLHFGVSHDSLLPASITKNNSAAYAGKERYPLTVPSTRRVQCMSVLAG
jgi:hypothetical protein